MGGRTIAHGMEEKETATMNGRLVKIGIGGNEAVTPALRPRRQATGPEDDVKWRKASVLYRDHVVMFEGRGVDRYCNGIARRSRFRCR